MKILKTPSDIGLRININQALNISYVWKSKFSVCHNSISEIIFLDPFLHAEAFSLELGYIWWKKLRIVPSPHTVLMYYKNIEWPIKSLPVWRALSEKRLQVHEK